MQGLQHVGSHQGNGLGRRQQFGLTFLHLRRDESRLGADRSQALAKFVVEFPRQVTTLLLAHGEEELGQATLLSDGLLQSSGQVVESGRNAVQFDQPGTRHAGSKVARFHMAECLQYLLCRLERATYR
ncbi:hypothetical protein D3C85_1006230 [compost metagenome]